MKSMKETKQPSSLAVDEPRTVRLGENDVRALCLDFWDDFPFFAFSQCDRGQLWIQFRNFVNLVAVTGAGREPMDVLMRKASLSRECLDAFAEMVRRVLTETDRPISTAELMTPVLEQQLLSPFYTEDEKHRLAAELHRLPPTGA